MSVRPRMKYETCSRCKKLVHCTRKALQCVYCKLWTHISCTKLTDVDCTAVNAGNSDWTCLTCVEELFPFAAIEDDIEYWNSLFIHSHGFRADSQLITNVGQLRLMTRSLKFDRDLDPNRNCLNLHKSSNYVTEGNFNSITHQITGGAYFSVLHINARSLIKKL